MGIIKRIASGLSSPRELISYINDKIYISIIYVFILLLVAAIPITLTTSFSPALTSTEKIQIIKNFNGDPAIPFKIVNGRLVHRFGLDDVFEYEATSTFRIVISQSTSIELSNIRSADYLVLSPDKAYLYTSGVPLKFELFAYSDYPGLANIDFSNATTGENAFWDEVFEVYRLEYNQFRPYSLVMNLVLVVFDTLLMLLGFSVLMTLFGRTELNQIYGFGKMWKLTIYAMAPYIFFDTIGFLFNEMLFRIIGIVITVIFVIRMGNHLINHYINDNKKNML